MNRFADYVLRILYTIVGLILFVIACIIKGRKVHKQNKVKALPNTNTVSFIRNANL